MIPIMETGSLQAISRPAPCRWRGEEGAETLVSDIRGLAFVWVAVKELKIRLRIIMGVCSN